MKTFKNGITFASRRSMYPSAHHVSGFSFPESEQSHLMVEEQRPGFKSVRRTYDLAITLQINFYSITRMENDDVQG